MTSAKTSQQVWTSSNGEDYLQLITEGGQVLSWIDSTGTAQGNLANGGGGSGAVSSVFGRTAAVIAQFGDYSFSQISGSLSASQMPSGLGYDSTLQTLGTGSAFTDGTLSSQVDYTSTSSSPFALLAGTHATNTVNASSQFPAGAGIAALYTGSAILSNSNITGLSVQSLQNGAGSISAIFSINSFAYNKAGTVTEINAGLFSAENDGTTFEMVSLEAGGGFNYGTVTDNISSFVVTGYQNFGTITGADIIGIHLQDVSLAGASHNYALQILDQIQTGAYAIKTGVGKVDFGDTVTLDKGLATTNNCHNGSSPAACGSAPAGSVAVPTGSTPTLVIDTTAVTASSQIILTIDQSLTIAATTCNTTLAQLVQPVVTARTPGVSFTIQINATVAVNPVCVSYWIVN